MTDERVNEEFEKWAVNPYSQEEVNFAFIACGVNERKASFYAGFRTAERLSKIEALEEVRIKIMLLDTIVPDNVVFSHYMQGQIDLNKEALKAIDSMIAELKEANR